jgi:hypothetical protein
VVWLWASSLWSRAGPRAPSPLCARPARDDGPPDGDDARRRGGERRRGGDAHPRDASMIVPFRLLLPESEQSLGYRPFSPHDKDDGSINRIITAPYNFLLVGRLAPARAGKHGCQRDAAKAAMAHRAELRAPPPRRQAARGPQRRPRRCAERAPNRGRTGARYKPGAPGKCRPR